MTNHGGMLSAPKDDWTANDAPLAGLFSVTLEDYYVALDAAGSSEVITISNSSLNGSAGQRMAHDSCIIVPPSGVTTVAEFPTGQQAWSRKTGYIAPPTPYFAVLVPYSQKTGAGSLPVVGNSGWPADEGSPMPAPGLAPYSSNLQFALNCISYMVASATQT
jgi:hypothetical protein